MPFTAAAIANEFLSLARQEGEMISPMKMQKLVYFAHGWHLALTGKPLLIESIQAWKYGPVINSLYHKLKKFGSGAINVPISMGIDSFYARLDQEGTAEEVYVARQIIQRVWREYRRYSPLQLSALTHAVGSPWNQIQGKEHHTPIPNKLIQEYFQHQAQQNG